MSSGLGKKATSPGSSSAARNSLTQSQQRQGVNPIWLILPLAVTYLHVLLSPYTKVEETPALHAVHDLLTHGFSKDKLQYYEHVKYPGAVPRSFIHSIVVAGMSKPIITLLSHFGLISTGLQVQTIIRFVLASLFCLSLGHMTTTLHRQSPTTAMAFVLLSVTQFHVPYYAGRTLPNFLALPLVILAFSLIIRGTDILEKTEPSPVIKNDSYVKRLHQEKQEDQRTTLSLAVALLVSTATVARLEIAPLALAVTGVLVLRGDISVQRALISGALGGLSGLALTSSIDIVFYSLNDYPLSWWSELSAFIFNIPQGRAAEWGVMPWSFYIMSLPKLTLSSLVFWNTGFARGKEITLLAVPCASIVFALSFIGHKEWRFIVYVVPLINVLAAQAVTRLWHMQILFWRRFWRLAFVGAICANIAITVVLTFVSIKNYPGGEIGPLLESLKKSDAKVWVPAAALHSGATVFTLPPTNLSGHTNMTIVRPESSYEDSHSPKGNSPLELWQAQYDLVVTDDWGSFEDLEAAGGRWSVVGEVTGYQGVQISKRWPFAQMKVGRRLAIMGRGVESVDNHS